jgi:hypothetical protein
VPRHWCRIELAGIVEDEALLGDQRARPGECRGCRSTPGEHLAS